MYVLKFPKGHIKSEHIDFKKAKAEQLAQALKHGLFNLTIKYYKG